jgi:hypothetical protein
MTWIRFTVGLPRQWWGSGTSATSRNTSQRTTASTSASASRTPTTWTRPSPTVPRRTPSSATEAASALRPRPGRGRALRHRQGEAGGAGPAQAPGRRAHPRRRARRRPDRPPRAGEVAPCSRPCQLLRVMCPSNDPDAEDVPAAKSMAPTCRAVKLPLAPTNRPVPPTIVATKLTCEMFGGTN